MVVIEVTWSAPEAGFGITASDDALSMWVEDEDGNRKAVAEGWDYFGQTFFPMFENAKNRTNLEGLFRYEDLLPQIRAEWEDAVRTVITLAHNYGNARRLF